MIKVRAVPDRPNYIFSEDGIDIAGISGDYFTHIPNSNYKNRYIFFMYPNPGTAKLFDNAVYCKDLIWDKAADAIADCIIILAGAE